MKLEIIEFYADWCGPCKLMLPIIDELIKENNDKKDFEIRKIDIDENTALAEKYNIMSIPVIIFLQDNKEVKRLSGIKDKESIQELINKYYEEKNKKISKNV